MSNNFCAPVNATVTLYYSPKYNVLESGGRLDVRPTPASYTRTSITWNVAGLSATASRPVDLYYAIWTDNAGGLLSPGDTTHSYVVVTPTSGDGNTNNNIFTKIDTVKAGCDPNYIIASPANCFTAADTQFEYTIHFENTGNDTAHNIYVLDTISEYLDINSLQLLTASAEMDISVIRDGGYNIIKFDFPQINLLDTSHHGLCDGAVFFTIHPKVGLADGTVITNKAGIYFDINGVVMTNEVQDVKGCRVTNVPVLSNAGNVELFPNPTTDELTIKTETQIYKSCIITNSVGQVLVQQTLNGTQTKVNVKMLPSGLYYVTVRGDNGSEVRKFVKL